VTDRRLAGVIQDVAMLDLTPMTSAEELAGITRISDVAIVLVPESLMAAVVGIPMDDVAMVVPVPTGVEVREHTGALVMGGEALADPDAENAALIVMGTLILTSQVPRVTYRQVIVMGLVLAPHGSESAPGAGGDLVVGVQQQAQHGHHPRHRHPGSRARRPGRLAPAAAGLELGASLRDERGVVAVHVLGEGEDVRRPTPAPTAPGRRGGGPAPGTPPP